jgi:BlaI family penicillinase repressor
MKKKELPRIADSEWRVMQVLWEHGPQTANDIVHALSGEVSWKPRTIKTLISRLVKKGAVKVLEEVSTRKTSYPFRSNEMESL